MTRERLTRDGRLVEMCDDLQCAACSFMLGRGYLLLPVVPVWSFEDRPRYLDPTSEWGLVQLSRRWRDRSALARRHPAHRPDWWA